MRSPVNPSLPTVLELCGSHGLDPVALANELLAFVTSRDLEPQLSADVLDAFEHEVGGPFYSLPQKKTLEKAGECHTLTPLLRSPSRC